jgi:hypothetical protein
VPRPTNRFSSVRFAPDGPCANGMKTAISCPFIRGPQIADLHINELDASQSQQPVMPLRLWAQLRDRLKEK